MSDSVIVLVSDNSYLQHAKALFAGCARQGSWRGDYALMCPYNCDTSEISGRGIKIVRAPEREWTNRIKFRLFDRSWSKWDSVLYMDLDCLVQGDLNEVRDALEPRLPKILCETQETTVMQDWEHFARAYGVTPETHRSSFERLREKFSCVDRRIFCSSTMFYSPSSIPVDTVERMFATQDEFRDINPGEFDQQVIDLVLYDQMEAMGKDYCCWWAFDDPGNRVPCETRNWRGDESPAILHYWSSFSPWLEKTLDAGAYLNHRLGRPCRDVYLDNLNSFNTTFPEL